MSCNIPNTSLINTGDKALLVSEQLARTSVVAFSPTHALKTPGNQVSKGAVRHRVTGDGNQAYDHTHTYAMCATTYYVQPHNNNNNNNIEPTTELNNERVGHIEANFWVNKR